MNNEIKKALYTLELSHLSGQLSNEEIEKCRNQMEKSWSGDLQKKFPNGKWVTISGARVFVNGGKVVAGLDGFNKEIDKFFDSKKQGVKEGGEGKKEKYKVEYHKDDKDWHDGKKTTKELDTFEEAKDFYHSAVNNKRGAVRIVHPETDQPKEDKKETETKGVTDKEATESLQKKGHKSPSDGMIEKERKWMERQKSQELSPEEKQYMEDNKKEIVDILKDDIFITRKEAIKEHKEASKGSEGKSESKLQGFEKDTILGAFKRDYGLQDSLKLKEGSRLTKKNVIDSLAQQTGLRPKFIEDNFEEIQKLPDQKYDKPKKEGKSEASEKQVKTAKEFWKESNMRQKLVVGAMLDGKNHDELTSDMGSAQEARFYENLSKKLGMFEGNVTLADSTKTLGELQSKMKERIKEMSKNEKVDAWLKGRDPDEKVREAAEDTSDYNITMDTFKEMAKKSKNVDDFIKKVRETKNVPPEVANAFSEKYMEGGKISPEKATEKLFNEARAVTKSDYLNELSNLLPDDINKAEEITKSDVYYALESGMGTDQIKFKKKGSEIKDKIRPKYEDYLTRHSGLKTALESVKQEITGLGTEAKATDEYGYAVYGDDYNYNNPTDADKKIREYNNLRYKCDDINKDIKAMRVLLENLEDGKSYELSARQLMVFEK